MIKLYRIKYEVKQYILTSIKGVQYINNDGILANLGISSKLAYGLIVQSILVIFSALISVWGIFEAFHGFTLSYITNIISLLVCISLLIYSFYGFNAKKNQEAFFYLRNNIIYYSNPLDCLQLQSISKIQLAYLQ